MEKEIVSETMEFHSVLTQLIAQEDLIQIGPLLYSVQHSKNHL
jgi:hypothetical protein